MEKSPLISVIVLSHNGAGILEPCLESVFKSDYPNFEVILVDNASSDASVVEEAIRLFGKAGSLKIVRNTANLFYPGGNNSGIAKAAGEYIFVLNDDTEIEKNCLSEIATAMKDESIGAAQPKILFFDEPKLIECTGGLLDRYGYACRRGHCERDNGQYNLTEEVFYADGAAMIIRKEALRKTGVFDEKFVAYWEEIDLSWRIRLAGYKIFFIPRAVVYHKVSRTFVKFGRQYQRRLSYHIRKNRIAGLIKNYGVGNLLKFLPLTILFYFPLFFKELLWDKNLKAGATAFSALFWNIKELPYLFKARRIVQKQIRKVADNQITKYMLKESVIFSPKFFRHGFRA